MPSRTPAPADPDAARQSAHKKIPPHVAVRGEGPIVLPEVLGSQVDFAAEDRAAEADFVLHRVAAETGVTLGQTDLVGEIRAEQADLPALADPGIDASTQVVVAVQRQEARVVLVMLADVLV